MSDDSLWSGGSFAKALSSTDIKKRMKTFHMKHDEDVNYDCIKCNKITGFTKPRSVYFQLIAFS